MEPHLSLVTLGVADLERATAFYTAIGLPRWAFDSDEAAFFALEGAWLSLYRRELLDEEVHASGETAGPGYGGVTLAHNVGSKATVDAVLDEAAEAGATIVQPGVDRSWGGYSGYFADPDGHHWEVAWNPHVDLA